MGAVEFKILGQLEVLSEGNRLDVGGPKQRAVLGLLVIEANRVVPIDRLVDQLWAGHPPARAIGTLQAYVSNLRRALEPRRPAGTPATVLVTYPPGYVLRVDPASVDAVRFEQLAEEGRRSLDGGDAEAGEDLLARALALWRGPALADFVYEPFAAAEAARLEELRLSALEDRLDAMLGLGRHHAVVADLEHLVATHPLRERLRGQLMLALYRSGRQAEALRCYDAGRRMLGEELGIEPSRALKELEERILAHDGALEWRPPPGVAGVAAPADAADRPPGEPTPPSGDEPSLPPDPAGGGAALVGRSSELSELERALAEAEGGHPRLVLVAGEPGIGKTRLAEEVGERAAARGDEVLWGRCDETEGAPAFWPWIQVLRLLTSRTDPAALSSALRSNASEIAQIVPEVKEVVGAIEPPPALDPEAARFRLYDCVSRFLVRLGRRRPLVLLLDDLHWADLASLQLLCFLTRQLEATSVLVVATYRDADVAPDHPLAAVLGELAREGVVRRVHVGGLGQRDVAAFLAGATGGTPSNRLVSEVHARTEGNPFFLTELVRLLQSEGGLSAGAGGRGELALPNEVPAGVRDVILRRLARLPPAAARVLTVAAVVGREFDLEVIERVEGLDGDRALELVECALLTRIVVESRDAVGRYRFSHALVRETLYDQLTALRRARLHGRVAHALEELEAGGEEVHAAELAHHFFLAAQAGGDAGKAVGYALRAAEHATAGLAYEEAVAQYERALEAMGRLRAPEPARRCELLLALGDAWWRAGEVQKARETFLTAAALAGELDDPRLLARAVLGFGGGLYRDWHATRGAYGDRLVELLERALAGVGEEDSHLRVRLLGHLAEELTWSGLDERRDRLSREAVEMARRLGDPAALASALCSRCLSAWSPESLAERLQSTAEIVRLAAELGSRELSLFGLHYLFVAQLEAGDAEAAGATLDDFERLAEELRQPLYLWEARWLRGLRAMLVGRFDDAERLVFEALDMGQRAEDPDALAVFGVQIGYLRLEQGRVAEMEPTVRAFVERYPETPSWRAALGFLAAELGHEDEARAVFEDLAAGGFAALPRNFAWLTGLALLTEVCAFLGDVERARTLHGLLVPFAAQNVLTSDRQCWGSVAHYLGILATTLGRFDEAERWFERARQVHSRMGARPWVAHTAYRQARLLLARGAGGDARRADALLDEAGSIARELGMVRLEARVVATRPAPAGAATAAGDVADVAGEPTGDVAAGCVGSGGGAGPGAG